MDEAAIWREMGDEGLRRLVAAFYRRIPGDDLLGPMYPAQDLVGAEERLYLFVLPAGRGLPLPGPAGSPPPPRASRALPDRDGGAGPLASDHGGGHERM